MITTRRSARSNNLQTDPLNSKVKALVVSFSIFVFSLILVTSHPTFAATELDPSDSVLAELVRKGTFNKSEQCSSASRERDGPCRKGGWRTSDNLA